MLFCGTNGGLMHGKLQSEIESCTYTDSFSECVKLVRDRRINLRPKVNGNSRLCRANAVWMWHKNDLTLFYIFLSASTSSSILSLVRIIFLLRLPHFLFHQRHFLPFSSSSFPHLHLIVLCQHRNNQI